MTCDEAIAMLQRAPDLIVALVLGAAAGGALLAWLVGARVK